MTWDPKVDQYARASRMLGYALTLDDDPEIWDGLALVLALELTRSQKARLFEAVFKATHPDDINLVLSDAMIERPAGSPLPVLVEIDDDARWWADLATLPELKAWVSTCFVRLPYRDQREFLAAAMRRTAA